LTTEAAPNCLFDSTHCSWDATNDLWKLSELDPPRYEYWRPGCGAVQNNNLRSPGYPSRYPMNIYCVYRVHIPCNEELIVYFKYFKLELEQNCRYDYLTITDDRRNTIGTYCGVQTGQRVLVVANVAVLTFRSDSSVQYRGFELIFSFSPRGNATLLPFSSPTPTTFQWPTATTTPGGFTYFQNYKIRKLFLLFTPI